MLIFASALLTVSLIVAFWGLTSLITLKFPVETQVPRTTAPGIIMVTIGVLAWSMWQQSLNVLRGHVAVPIGRAIGVAVVVYVIWSVLGMLAGMPAAETWLSPFAIELIPIFVLGALCGWWVLLRRVYTNKPTPQWPWEKKDQAEREIEELNDIWHSSSDEGDDDTPPQERL